jgi:hypothetical protein
VTFRHATVVLPALVAVLTLAAPTPAHAGGTWLSPVHEHYLAGDHVTIVGYSAGTGSEGSVADSPYFGYLRLDPREAYRDQPDGVWPFVHPSDLRVDELEIRPTGRRDWAAFRLELDFVLPTTMAAGAYEVVVCNDPCDNGFADVIGATVYVGVAPPQPIVREWLLDDPAIAELDPNALVWLPEWPGYHRTAIEIRRGETTPGPAPVQPQPATTVDAATTMTTNASAETPPDVRLTDHGESSPFGGGTLWLAALGVAASAFVALRRVGPRRKHVHTTTGTDVGSDGQAADETARWPGRVVRL